MLERAWRRLHYAQAGWARTLSIAVTYTLATALLAALATAAIAAARAANAAAGLAVAAIPSVATAPPTHPGTLRPERRLCDALLGLLQAELLVAANHHVFGDPQTPFATEPA